MAEAAQQDSSRPPEGFTKVEGMTGGSQRYHRLGSKTGASVSFEF
jgi:hypothetical protein